MSGATILVADDDRAIRTVLTQALGRQGHSVRTTGNAATLWQWVKQGEGDVVITDVVMPDENGLDLIPRIKKLRPGLRVIVMSARNTLLTAVKATERGAFEYLPKPFDLRELVSVVERALSEPGRTPSGAPSPEAAEEQLPLIGRSGAMQDIYRVLARLMGTDLSVIVYGESGTGKELIARALHDYGKRRNGPFVAINMAAVPRELIESELFGHEKGAFTGAARCSSTRSATCRSRPRRACCVSSRRASSRPWAAARRCGPTRESSPRPIGTCKGWCARACSARTCSIA
jgi:two-component system nitrogen regulation response regulator GlnG